MNPTAYQVVVADPPWRYEQSHMRPLPYPTLSIDEMKDMGPLTDKSALLFMWTTGPQMDDSLQLMHEWGFQYVTVVFVWVKETKKAEPFMGMGVYTRSNCEFVILGRKGKGVSNWVKDHSIMQIIRAPRREHSRKPDEFFEALDKLLVPDLRKLEMFSRQRRPGWDATGNDVDHFDPITAAAPMTVDSYCAGKNCSP